MLTQTLPRANARPRSNGRMIRALGWLLIAAGALAYVYAALVRPWHTRWGASDGEVAATLPGDELVPQATTISTRAITIEAPPQAIWPWLAQLGQGRGGFYSYELIENVLLGCDIANASTVVPAWQQVQPGDKVKMAANPEMPPAYIVAQASPNHALVLGHHLGLSEDPASAWGDSWQFVIVPIDQHSSRLILRTRVHEAPWVNKLLEPGIFIMEQRMLRGVKERAEALAASQPQSALCTPTICQAQ